MAYQGNQIDYNNLNNELKLKVDKAEGVESQVQALSPKVSNSWQKNVFNDADITNIGNSSASKVFRFDKWDDDNSKLDSLYINIPVGRAFSGLVKLTLTSNYNFGNAMGGAEIVYNVAKVEEDVFLNTMTINNISQHFATCFYIKPLVTSASRMYIPITKAPTTRNAIDIKVEIFSSLAIFDVVNNITLALDPTISQPHPWTPQTSNIPTSSQIARWNNKADIVASNVEGSDPDTEMTQFFISNNEKLGGGYWYVENRWYAAVGFTSQMQVAYKYANGQPDMKSRFKYNNVWSEWSPSLQDLKQSVSDGKTKVASAISDKGVYTSPVETFDNMANNIRAIPSGGKKAEFDLIFTNVTSGSIQSVTTPPINFQPMNSSSNLLGAHILNGQAGTLEGLGTFFINGMIFVEKCVINNIGGGNYSITITVRNRETVTIPTLNYKLVITG